MLYSPEKLTVIDLFYLTLLFFFFFFFFPFFLILLLNFPHTNDHNALSLQFLLQVKRKHQSISFIWEIIFPACLPS